MEFVKDLWIKQKEKLIVNNEESSVKSILNSCIWVQNQWADLKTIREYCISNIGQLLMLNPVFANQEIQEKIEAIKTKDDEIMQKRKELYPVFWNELIWEWKPYLLQNWWIWYSFGTLKSEDWITIRPSATPITNDVLWFKPINEKFSTDSKNAYFQYYQIWNNVKPNLANLEPIENSNYSCDWENVFHWFNHVEWAIIDWKYEIINNDKVELLKDSEGDWFSWHKKAKIKYPERCEYVVDNFLFDWECVYMVSWSSVYNFTELFWLKSGNNISKIWENTYQIWEKSFTHDGLIEIKRL